MAGAVPVIRKTGEEDIDRHDDLKKLDGFLLGREGARLARLASQVPANQCIVEIGSFKGKSACFLARGSKAGNRVKVHCVDLWDLGGQVELQADGQRNTPRGSGDPDTWKAFNDQIEAARCKSMIVVHKGSSVEVAARWAGPSIGLLFIDGDHTYDGALADIRAWSPHLAPGAWVAWHDYARPRRFPGVFAAVNDWLVETPTVEVTLTAKLLAARLP